MTEGELKPCPFCGKPPLIVCPDNSYGSALVTCGDDNECLVDLTAWADLRVGETLAEAIAAWNTRTPTATPSDEVVEEFLHELAGWERAYPLSMFPEPDMRKAAELLKAGGITLDAISASNMRHVVSQIAPKARAAIATLSAIEGEKK